MAEFSKLQIRAKVLSVISEIKSAVNLDEDLFVKLMPVLQEIDDKESLFDIFIKEYIKLEEKEYMYCSYILNGLISKDYIQEKSFDILKSPSYSDESKYKIVQLLRVIGTVNAVDAIPQYFENPEEVIDLETQKLMENAVINPESMLDFLDFIYTVSDKDKKILLASIKDDYQGDFLANIVYPILYADFDDDFKIQAVELLCDSKSSVAIGAINYLLSISNNEKVIHACNVALKKLKLAGASEQKAQKYFLNVVANSEPKDFYTTIPDGNGNQALLSSRINNEGNYTFSAVVINDNFGIIDCFGFYNIPKSEFDKITDKFFNSEGQYKVSPEYVKFQINNAFENSKRLKRKLPYEFVCWSPLLADIMADKENINYNPQKDYSKDDILNVLIFNYTYRWYITTSENKRLKELIDSVYNLENPDIDLYNNMFFDAKDKIFTEEVKSIWKNRLAELIYILTVNNYSEDADKFKFILKNNEMFNIFLSVLLQRSIVNNIVNIKETQKGLSGTVNIFRKKTMQGTEYDLKKLDLILNILERNWINE